MEKIGGAEEVGVFGEKGEFNPVAADRFAEAYGLDVAVYEAPTKPSQFAFLNHFGPDVHLSNVRIELEQHPQRLLPIVSILVPQRHHGELVWGPEPFLLQAVHEEREMTVDPVNVTAMTTEQLCPRCLGQLLTARATPNCSVVMAKSVILDAESHQTVF